MRAQANARRTAQGRPTLTEQEFLDRQFAILVDGWKEAAETVRRGDFATKYDSLTAQDKAAVDALLG